ncbi:MFS transporter [bacterium LRH843]|nr:MFS transporter [bacterium LRH843]
MRSKLLHSRMQLTSILFLIGMIIVASNLRSSITSVGPLIGTIRIDTGMSSTTIGLLTTLPLLAFGVFSTIAPKLGRKYGNETVVFLALLTLTLGILLRSFGTVFALFTGTILMGLSIAICNVLILTIVKEKYPEKIGMMTGLFTTSMSSAAALASGISIPLAHNFNLGWEKSLGIWALASAAALIAWLPQLRRQTKKITISRQRGTSIWRSTLAWQVMLFMGFQSSIFFCMVAWLPEILASRGVDIQMAGWMLTIMQFTGLPATLLIPIVAARLVNQKSIVIGITLLYVTGFCGTYFLQNLGIIIFCMFLLGIAQGAGISLCLTLFGLRTKNAQDAAELSGMAQSGGYLLAAIGPLLMGFLYDVTGNWMPAFLMFSILIFALMIFGLFAGRNQTVFQSFERVKLRA